MKKKVRRLALLFFAVVFVVSGCLLARDLIRSNREREANQDLARQVHQAREETQRRKEASAVSALSEGDGEEEEEAEWSPYASSGVLLQYDSVWQSNNDMAGWLYIEGTQVDYPVMFTPDDPEHYLRRAFDGSYAVSGSLFLGAGWSPQANSAIIYGHYMKNGSMFGSLGQYKSEEYFQEHPVIRFDTLTEEREYQIVGAFYSRVYTTEETGVFRYYKYTDLSQQEVFEEYVRQVKAAALYDTGVEAQYGDRILTLSTCSYHTQNGRFVVVAVSKGEEPDLPSAG